MIPKKLKNIYFVTAGAIFCSLLFWGWILWSPERIGNDYQAFQISQAMNFRFFQAIGLEPMWHCFITGGLPIQGLGLAQVFNVVGWLTSHLPGYWEGRALDWFTLRFLFLGVIGQLVFFAFVRTYWPSCPRLLAFCFSLTAFFQLRTLDFLRYGTGLDATVAGYAALLGAAIYLKNGKKTILWAVGAATYFFFTSGYPVLLPFLVLAAGVFGLALYLSGEISWKKLPRIFSLLGFAAAGFLLAAPNWVPFLEWASVNERRVQASTLAWANFLPMTPRMFLANVWFPWGAEVHSGFGGSTFWILVMGSVAFLAAMSGWRGILLLGLLVTPFLYSLGAVSPLFKFFFEHIPGFSSIRSPGRILYVLPFFFAAACLVLWPKIDTSMRRLKLAMTAVGLVAALGYGAVMIGIFVWPLNHFGGESSFQLTPETLNSQWGIALKTGWLLLGIFCCLAFAWASRQRSERKLGVAFGIMLACSLLQLTMMMHFGTWHAPRNSSPTLADYLKTNQLPLYGEFPMIAGNGLYEGTWGTATLPYARFIKALEDKAECYLPVKEDRRDSAVLLPFYLPLEIRCGQDTNAIFSAMKQEPCFAGVKPVAFTADAQVCGGETHGSQNIVEANKGNQILALGPNVTRLAVSLPHPSILVTPFPNITSNWIAKLDGKAVRIVEVDGAFVGVAIPAGNHQVEIRYFSTALILSLRIAFAMILAAVLGLICQFYGDKKRWALVFIAIPILLGAYVSYEHAFVKRARKEVLLKNNYDSLLQDQLKRWGGNSR